MSQVLVTGATGFVGSTLVSRLDAEGVGVRGAVRREVPASGSFEPLMVGAIDGATEWADALVGVDAVVHLAARVHVMDEVETDPREAFRRVNVEGTLRLARQAAEAGVKRFVFISSIKVNGEQTPLDTPFAADDDPAPSDAYGISKHEAEQGLLALAEDTGMEVVIIRPPLVYGPGVKANFLSMMRWVHKGVPLPLGAIHNRRSLVARANLVDLIVTCLEHPAAANQIFLAGDGEDLSTTELLQRMARALDKPARLLPVSMKFLEMAARLAGKQAVAQRLCGSLRVDISKARDLLGWNPPVSVDEALQETAEAFLRDRNR
jgi:nucleoside-diphosphate-sugar epimerase